jgi:hypothetical protein
MAAISLHFNGETSGDFDFLNTHCISHYITVFDQLDAHSPYIPNLCTTPTCFINIAPSSESTPV